MQAVAELIAEESAAAAKIAANNKELVRLGKSIASIKSLAGTTAKELGQANERLAAEKSCLINKKQAMRNQAESRMKAQAAQLRALCLTRQAAPSMNESHLSSFCFQIMDL